MQQPVQHFKMVSHQSVMRCAHGSPASRTRRGLASQIEPDSEAAVDLSTVMRPLGLSPSWQLALAGLATMVILALLDFIGAVFAKEWADTRNPVWFAAALTAFVLLFAFYAGSLKTAELSIVTIGWVVFLQVGLLLYERIRFGAELAPGKWAVIVVILLLQAYLVLAPNGKAGADIPEGAASTAVARAQVAAINQR